jgi:O-antigen/teichoic acid export membrane protein
MSLGRKILLLQILQLCSLALPLLVQVWLARSLGPVAYGRLTFVMAIAAYWILFCDFGFGWSATRLVAVHRDDRQKCSEIIVTTLLAKCVLFVAGGMVVAALTAFVAEIRMETKLVAMSCLGVLGAVFSPTWYFQGVERLHVALGVDIIVRAIALPVVILMVSEPDDLLIAVTITAVTQLVSGLIGALWLLKDSGMRWTPPTPTALLSTLKEGAPLFFSSSAVSLYTASSSLILGFTSSREQVGYFGLAQKLAGAACSVLAPFNQLFYPQASRAMRASGAEASRLVRQALVIQGFTGLALTLTLLLAGPPLLTFLFGVPFEGAIASLMWLAPLPVAIAIGGVFANLVMLPAGRDTQHLLMTASAGALNILLLLALAHRGAVGAAIALLAAECFVAVYAVTLGLRLTKPFTRTSIPIRSGE